MINLIIMIVSGSMTLYYHMHNIHFMSFYLSLVVFIVSFLIAVLKICGSDGLGIISDIDFSGIDFDIGDISGGMD